MGQQQLLLLVLGIVIVGLAVVVGIQAFSENQEKSRGDAIQSDQARMLADVKTALAKPATMGGVDSIYDISDLGDIGYEVDANGHYSNPNGLYSYSTGIVSEIMINGCSGSTMYYMYTYEWTDEIWSGSYEISSDCAASL